MRVQGESFLTENVVLTDKTAGSSRFLIIPQLRSADVGFYRLVVQSSSAIMSLEFLEPAHIATFQGEWSAPCKYKSDENPRVTLKVSEKTSLLLKLDAPGQERLGLKFVVARAGDMHWPSEDAIVASSSYTRTFSLSLEAEDLEPNQELEVWMTLEKPEQRTFTLTCLAQAEVKLGTEVPRSGRLLVENFI